MKKYILALLFVVLCPFQGLMPASVHTQLSSHAKFACVWGGLGATWAGISLYSHYSHFVKEHPNATFGEYFAELSNDVYQNKGAIAKRGAFVLGAAGLGHSLIYYNRAKLATEQEKSLIKEAPGDREFIIQTPRLFKGQRAAEVERAKLFEEVFGISEKAFQANFELLSPEVDQSSGCLFVTPKAGIFSGRKINCGKFEQLSIGKLREATKDITTSSTPGTFKIIEGIVDVAELETRKENSDAVFQVASRFNACDGVSLRDYYENTTQGPTAGLPALGGTLLRHYFMYYDPSTDKKTWRQSSTRFVNLLGEVSDKIKPQCDGFVRPKELIADPSQSDYEKIMIGFHENIDVVAGPRKGENQTVISDETQQISQVLTSALDLSSRNNSDREKQWEQMILNASYEGTLRAAALAGKKKVFLTLIGGGVFNNAFESIGNAITLMKDFVKKSGLEVTVVLYGKPQQGSEEAAFRTRLARELAS